MRLVILSVMLSSAAYAVDVATCGQMVLPGDVAQVVADLDCTGAPTAPAVTLEPGSTLLLDGHAVSGGQIGIETEPGKKGGPTTRIIGPGEITGMTGCAIWAQNRISVQNVDLHENGCGITVVYNYPLTLSQVSVTDNAGDGITYLSVLGNGRIDGDGVTITGNRGDGILTTGKVKLEDALVQDNGGVGVESILKSIRVLRGTLVHNTDGDVVSFRRSKLVEATCGHSVDLRNGGTFAICTLD
jgi:hypothetical protein